MKTKNITMLGVTALSLGAGLAATQTNADASAWHRSAIPAHLQGNWKAKQDHTSGVKIYRYTIRFYGYGGSNTIRHAQWKYIGNHFYKFRSGYSDDSYMYSTLHYFGRHKMSMNSFWHSYVR